MVPLIIVFLIIAGCNEEVSGAPPPSSPMDTNVKFVFFDKSGYRFETTVRENGWPHDIQECNQPNGTFAFVVHGWLESCRTEWLEETVSKLLEYRGGCVVCMDYHPYSNNRDYFQLVRVFEPLSQLLTVWIRKFAYVGFKPVNGFMFGFSFGGRLVLDAAQRFGVQKIGAIDTCDMAGPGFDGRGHRLDPKLSAINVQCIHTSSDKGTSSRNCHQNWSMGNCGYRQDAAGPAPKGSHGLCPYIYNTAFERDFMAVRRPRRCAAIKEAICWPDFYKMGYMEKRRIGVYGNFFALTDKGFPYSTTYIDHKPCINDNVIYRYPEDENEPVTEFNDVHYDSD